MDIRRIPLWEARNATYMSNDLIKVIIEDQGDVVLELSSKNSVGGRTNALCLPYFRGIGSGVETDPNIDWYKAKTSFYQAGGSYISFPSKDEEHVLTRNTYWNVRRYGFDAESGGVWRLSEMRSRENGNRYRIHRISLLLPGQPVLYTLCKIENSNEKDFECNLSMHSMLGSPFLESGASFYTSSGSFIAFPPNVREVAFNRLKSGKRFSDLRHAPSAYGGTTDASYIPGPTGTYDYLMGNIERRNDLGWSAVINPRQQLIYMNFFPSHMDLGEDVLNFPKVEFAMNYCGRMDTPWALYDGATPEVFSFTAGFGYLDSHGSLDGDDKLIIPIGGSKIMLAGQALMRYDNARMNSGFYSLEKGDNCLICKRTKSTITIPCNHDFSVIRKLAREILEDRE
ncbi:MAG: hypothetical protein IJ836_01995 [Spirochaetales bacterium]|nr:hypothetical protein [Spirochaetales bacterium]